MTQNRFSAIAENTCPYFRAPYGIAFGGCRDRCAAMQYHQQLIREAIDDLERRALTRQGGNDDDH